MEAEITTVPGTEPPGCVSQLGSPPPTPVKFGKLVPTTGDAMMAAPDMPVTVSELSTAVNVSLKYLTPGGGVTPSLLNVTPGAGIVSLARTGLPGAGGASL